LPPLLMTVTRIERPLVTDPGVLEAASAWSR
jgi:hypothetical protein